MTSGLSHGGTGFNTGLEYLETLAKWKGQGGFGLHKLRAVMANLKDPQDAVPSAHIAGTNGKGSVSAAFSSILGSSGASVLLNSSPHLVRVNERICINGLQVSDQDLNWALELIRDTSQQLRIDLSHFEAITGAAFLLGAEHKVDWGVFEVGLGGRLDATNILKSPRVSAIVSIDFDHEAILGSTLPLIAVEKAGIVKPKVPTVIGKVTQEVQWEIDRVATERGSTTFVFGRDFWVEPMGECKYRLCSPAFGEVVFSPALKGSHQVENMSVAAVMALLLGVDKQSISEGISSVQWPARLSEHLVWGRRVLFDAAHNPAGVASLISFLDMQRLKGVEVVFGALRSKQWQGMVQALLPYAGRWRVVEPDSDEAVSSDEVLEYLSGFGVNGDGYCRNYLDLLDIVRSGSAHTPVIVTGSIYMVGKVMNTLGCEIPQLWKRSDDRR